MEADLWRGRSASPEFRGDRARARRPVATMLPSTTDYLAAWHGIVWRNCIDVPINTEYKGLFLEHVLRDSDGR